jgi:hypothetical protein
VQLGKPATQSLRVAGVVGHDAEYSRRSVICVTSAMAEVPLWLRSLISAHEENDMVIDERERLERERHEREERERLERERHERERLERERLERERLHALRK